MTTDSTHNNTSNNKSEGQETTGESTRQKSDNLHLLNSASQARELNTRIQDMDRSLGELAGQLQHSRASLQQEFQDLLAGIQKAVSQQDEAVKELQENLQQQNSQTQSRLHQVKHNFSFHDTKILNLHAKNTELKEQTRTILATLQEDKTEQKKKLQSLEHKLQRAIRAVTDETKEQQQHLNSELQLARARITDIESTGKGLVRLTQQIESRMLSDAGSEKSQLANTLAQFEHQQTESINQLKQSSKRHYQDLQTIFQVDLQKTDAKIDKYKQDMLAHEKSISRQETHLLEYANKIEQLESVGDMLNQHVHDLVQTTQHLNMQGESLEKTTDFLQERGQFLQQNLADLAVKNNSLEQKTTHIEEQLSKHFTKTEKNYQLLTSGFAVLVFVTLAALIYNFMQQQSLWRESLHNTVNLERQLNEQIAQQQVALIEAEQQRINLNTHLVQISEQLNTEQKKSDILTLASQNKSLRITRLKGELQDVDENVQYLNYSVGPFSAFDYKAQPGKLNNDQWLAAQPPGNYTIQLTSVKSRQALYQFIERNAYSFTHSLAYFTIQRDGTDYYVLTYGNFTDMTQARIAMNKLPWFVSEASPGIASLSAVQNFIN